MAKRGRKPKGESARPSTTTKGVGKPRKIAKASSKRTYKQQKIAQDSNQVSDGDHLEEELENDLEDVNDSRIENKYASDDQDEEEGSDTGDTNELLTERQKYLMLKKKKESSLSQLEVPSLDYFRKVC